MYDLPLRSVKVFFLTSSRTLTTPWATRVSVVVQVSWTSHLVPRTVAAEYWPLVLELPLPSPHSLRVLGFFAAARALPLALAQSSGSLSVGGRDCRPAD